MGKRGFGGEKGMVAVVRGERNSSPPRSKSAASARSVSARPRTSAKSQPRAKQPPVRAGLDPRLGLGVAVVVIVGGAVAGLWLSHRQPAGSPAPPSPSFIGRALAPLGFRLQHVEIEGAPDMAKADILREAHLNTGQPIIGIGLEAVRQRIEATGWVKDAKVVRLLPDTLIVAVQPRQALAVWQHQGQTRVVDGEGKVIGAADPGRFPDLPLVVGEGAAEEAHAILPLLRQQPQLYARLDALVRVDGRRWDLRLKDGSLIQLPAIGEDQALIRLGQLEQQQRLLSLGFERIDLRDPSAMVVRPKAAASSEPGPAKH